MSRRKTFTVGSLALALVALWAGCWMGGSEESRSLGQGTALDHVGLAVRNLDNVERLFTTGLGFTSAGRNRLPNGLDNVTIWFPDTTYLEIVTPYDAQKAPEITSFLQRTEGGRFFALKVGSAQAAADSLRSWNLQIDGPQSMPVTLEGADETPPEMFWLVSFREAVVPSDPLFFIQYNQAALDQLNLEHPELNPLRSASHANTATGLRSVWMAVTNLGSAVASLESLGFTADTLMSFPSLRAQGRVVRTQRGDILLLTSSEGGPVAGFLRERGDGVMGVTLRVRDLAQARAAISRVTRQPPPVSTGIYGAGVAVSPELTGGLWIELVQPGSPP
jgi:hypothetical protein